MNIIEDDNKYFVYNGEKYIVKYEDKTINIYKYNNEKVEVLSDEETQRIKLLLNSKYSYIYDSIMLSNLVNENSEIEKKEYIINFLNWLESIIPENCGENFYRNITTLKTTLNIDIDISKCDVNTNGYSISAGYNTINNSLTMNETSLSKLWTISQLSQNPQDFYWRHYSQTLLHELAHMASSRYNPETKTTLCGFDKFPAENENDKNRGLTEGFTEIISMAGVPGTVEISSGYYIEALLINQLIQLIGKEVFLKSYFSNLGTKNIQEKLNQIINNPEMSFNLFRNIELNYNIRNINEEQNILGNIQSSLLDYLDKKIELLLANNKFDEINSILTNYELMIISPEKLKIMKKDSQQYVGIAESIEKFSAIKIKYEIYLNENIQSSSLRSSNTKIS